MYPSGKNASVFGRIGSWPTDYPKADRQFVQGVRRLTRIHTRSSEQVVDLDNDEVFNWPWLYAVEMGHSDWTDAECAKMREYLLRGGFFMCDDFNGNLKAAHPCTRTPGTSPKGSTGLAFASPSEKIRWDGIPL
jgi:hypothetical protein